MQSNPFGLGLVFGLVLAFCHALWAALVALGWAQTILDFIFWAHFISPAYHVVAFDLSRAFVLVGLTFAIGLILGTIGTALWNKLASDGA
jgi:hypothetical protein